MLHYVCYANYKQIYLYTFVTVLTLQRTFKNCWSLYLFIWYLIIVVVTVVCSLSQSTLLDAVLCCVCVHIFFFSSFFLNSKENRLVLSCVRLDFVLQFYHAMLYVGWWCCCSSCWWCHNWTKITRPYLWRLSLFTEL